MSILRLLLFFIAHLLLFPAIGQDTIFIRSIPLDSTVKNITTDGTYLFFRFDKTLYYLNKGKLKFHSNAQLKFTEIELNPIKNEKIINHKKHIESKGAEYYKSLNAILPDKSNFYTTSVSLGDHFYICNNGVVLEYRIRDFLNLKHEGRSVRHVFSEPGLRVVSTYNGIFIDEFWAKFNDVSLEDSLSNYSNGEFIKIDSNYYLCQDNLLQFDPTTKKFITIINTENKPRFRKLISFNGKVYALYDQAFGELDIEKRERLPFLIERNLTDCILIKDLLYVSSSETKFYRLDKEGNLKMFTAPYKINDLSQINGKLHIGTEKGLYKFSNNEISLVAEGEVVQALESENSIIISNNNGLYIFHDNTYRPIIEGIEFNKLALNTDEHYLYAGSVNGLYVMEKSDLIHYKQNKQKMKTEIDSFYSALLPVLIVVVLFIGIIVVAVFRYRNQNIGYENDGRKIYNIELISKIIAENPKILSAESLAEHLNTSVVQINRHLKKEGTTSLKVMKQVKKEIALDMYQKGKSTQEISKRTGYSVRFVKTNFLKDR